MENKKMSKPYTNLLTFLLPLLTLAFSFISLPSFAAGAGVIAVSGDAQKLLSFKATLPNPDTLSNWQPDINPCIFAGVSCSGAGEITALDLSRLSLSSDFQSVSGNLFTLDHLTSLKLSSTNISGQLSPIPSCSPSIAIIDLSLNSVAGSPTDLSVFTPCSSLSSLNLSFNHIESPKGSLVNSHIKLQTLDLSGNRLAGNGFLPWLLSNGCPQFTNLTIRVSKLEGNFSLNGCDKLHHFDVSHNNFSTEIPKLGLCARLKHLDLSSNRFSGSIGDEFLNCKKLIYLNISGNKLSGPIPALPTSDLRFLYLSGNEFEGQIHGGRISNSIVQACPNLVEADLSMNRFSGDLPIGLEFCSSLRLFDLSGNRFNGDLPIDVLAKMKDLRKLNLASNRFIGVLPDSISSIASLETLDLSSNNISGEIPVGFCRIQKTQLKELYLQDNLLTGSVPSDLSNCSELVSLDLSFNYLSGSIPPSLGFLSNLKDLILLMNLLEGEIPQQLMYIQSLENLFLDYNNLVGPIPSGFRDYVNLQWISLSNNRFSGEIPPWLGNLTKLAILNLSNNSFFGNIPPELGNCKSLLWLDLGTNLLNGTIPPSIAKQSGKLDNVFVAGKKFVYLKSNGSKLCHGAGNLLEFAGVREASLNRIPAQHSCNFTTRTYTGITQANFQHNGSMLFLDLSYNSLEGEIPKELGSMSHLEVLSLAHNQLSGPIPSELQGLTIVGVMDLSYNRLSGEIPPSLGSLARLTDIDLSNNHLSGKIPDSGQLGTFPPSRFYNNSGLCGYQLSPCARNASAVIERRGRQRQRRGTLIASIAMGLIIAFLCVFGVVVSYIELTKRRTGQNLDLRGRSESRSNSGNGRWRVPRTREALSINLAAFEKPLRKLTFADLVEASRGFHYDCLIGSGGFGDVYKATLKDGSVVAIKKLIHVSGQGDREFMAEMETIGKIKHRNLVPLLGYCKVGEERLLVYEYMAFGSLENLLHCRKKSPAGMKLDWAARRRIAVGTARGLAFLHHSCIPHIIHRDMKSSNVLIDDRMEARVSDFGMARLMSAMDTHLSVSTLAGTPGYVPPEYCQSFRCSAKGDVYSFGVVLLELLSGRRPTDSSDFGDNNLVGWVKLHTKMKISDVFDPDLMKEDPRLELELLEHLKVAVACLDDRPWRRPTMLQVLAMFKDIQAGSMAAGDGGFDEAAVGGVDGTMKEILEAGKL